LLVVSRKKSTMGAKDSKSTAVTVIAVRMRAKFWVRLWLDPKRTLKKYRVGEQTTNVARKRIGNLSAELNVCHRLCVDPITAP
jgi:hypothetical protein